jgi:hypothetical protein
LTDAGISGTGDENGEIGVGTVSAPFHNESNSPIENIGAVETPKAFVSGLNLLISVKI